MLPKRNEGDLDDVPEAVRETMTFHLADTYADVVAVAFAANQGVGACAAIQSVVAEAARDKVVARAAIEGIARRVAGHDVVESVAYAVDGGGTG